MLERLSVKNVALIESAEISFSEGLNVLSGETGAGKSVLLDSVNFVLGAKADKTMIRYGESECFVKAEFILPSTSKAVKALQELDIDSDGEIIISRRFGADGKSTVKINGNTVSATMLRFVTDALVDVHGQSEHFFLLSEKNQLSMLDSLVGDELVKEKERLSALLNEKSELLKKIDMIGGSPEERNRRRDILKFQIDEIEIVGIKDGEEEELVSKKNKINHLEKIITAVRDCLESFSSENGIVDEIRYAKRSLGAISKLDKDYDELFSRIDDLSLDAEDISESLSSLFEGLYFDENEANEIESRLDSISDLKRKYGGNKEEIDLFYEKAKNEYELLSDCEGQYERLTNRLDSTYKSIYDVCSRITALRKQKGDELCKNVVEELKTLNIPSAKFEISFGEYTLSDAEKATKNGLDEVCFLFSANAGEPVKPLGKIISGGEMSRFMLAIKTQLKDVNGISTYIFDEIDAGISGKTAKVVGEKFAKIAKNTQIIAVSHLAQIASMSDKEFLIEKKEIGEKTVTNVRELDEEGKVGEIIRLLGGDEKDKFARGHAEELVKQADEYKRTL